jgi:hypothetical protein
LRIGAAADGERRYIATAEKAGPVALVSEDRFKDILAGPAYFTQAEEKKPDSGEPGSDEKKADSDKSDSTNSDADSKNAPTRTEEKK